VSLHRSPLTRLRPPISFHGWCRGSGCCARCAAVQQGRRSRPDRQSGPAALAGFVNGAGLARRRCGLPPVPPRSAARATGGALSFLSPYRRSPLPNPISYRAGLSWGITSPGRLGGHPSSRSLVPDPDTVRDRPRPRPRRECPPYACRRASVDGRRTNGRSPCVTAVRVAHSEALRTPQSARKARPHERAQVGHRSRACGDLGASRHAQRPSRHAAERTCETAPASVS
jgi:hypothetical protein